MSSRSTTEFSDAGLARRLAAAAYDSLLVLALFVIPTSAVMAIRGGAPVPPGSLLFQALLLATAGAFFVGFWMHGGQTLGMRAWRLRVVAPDGGNPTLGRCLIRFIACLPSVALGGAGIWWLLFDPHGRTVPDRIAGTRVVVVAKR